MYIIKFSLKLKDLQSLPVSGQLPGIRSMVYYMHAYTSSGHTVRDYYIEKHGMAWQAMHNII